jgi:hypothetical protein
MHSQPKLDDDLQGISGEKVNSGGDQFTKWQRPMTESLPRSQPMVEFGA